jgi:hypothetical protein
MLYVENRRNSPPSFLFFKYLFSKKLKLQNLQNMVTTYKNECTKHEISSDPDQLVLLPFGLFLWIVFCLHRYEAVTQYFVWHVARLGFRFRFFPRPHFRLNFLDGSEVQVLRGVGGLGGLHGQAVVLRIVSCKRQSGLPDISWYKIPKNIPNYHQITKMAIK